MVNHCVNDPCENGQCLNKLNSYICNCSAGFTGKNCEISKQSKFCHTIIILHTLSLLVVQVYIKPQLTTMPRSVGNKLYSSVSLTCQGIGSPPPLIQWYKDDQPIQNTNDDTTVLTISDLSLADRGFYHCEARNIVNGKSEIAASERVLVGITGKIPPNILTKLKN